METLGRIVGWIIYFPPTILEIARRYVRRVLGNIHTGILFRLRLRDRKRTGRITMADVEFAQRWQAERLAELEAKKRQIEQSRQKG